MSRARPTGLKCPTQSVIRSPLARRKLRPRTQDRLRVVQSHRYYATDVCKDEKPFTLDAFYAEILKQPGPKKIASPPLDPNNPPKAGLPKEATPQEKARVIFGSRLAGPVDRRRELERKSTIMAGILVPPRPEEPDNCCMSGCVNCVWDRYRDEIEDWAEKSAEAGEKLRARSASSDIGQSFSKRRTNPSASQSQTIDHTITSMDDDGGGSEALWSNAASSDYFEGIPVGIREFMKTEKRLKQKKAAAGIDKF